MLRNMIDGLKKMWNSHPAAKVAMVAIPLLAVGLFLGKCAGC